LLLPYGVNTFLWFIALLDVNVKYSFFPIELFDTVFMDRNNIVIDIDQMGVFMDRNNIVIDIDQMVHGRCIICLQVLSNVACVRAPWDFS